MDVNNSFIETFEMTQEEIESEMVSKSKSEYTNEKSMFKQFLIDQA